jgi:hypothetical protein
VFAKVVVLRYPQCVAEAPNTAPENFIELETLAPRGKEVGVVEHPREAHQKICEWCGGVEDHPLHSECPS